MHQSLDFENDFPSVDNIKITTQSTLVLVHPQSEMYMQIQTLNGSISMQIAETMFCRIDSVLESNSVYNSWNWRPMFDICLELFYIYIFHCRHIPRTQKANFMDDGPIATAKVCCFSLQNLSAVPGGKYWSDMPLCFKSVMKHHFQMSHTL